MTSRPRELWPVEVWALRLVVTALRHLRAIRRHVERRCGR